MGGWCSKGAESEDDEGYNYYEEKYRFSTGQNQGQVGGQRGPADRRMTTVAMLASMAHHAGGMLNQMNHTTQGNGGMDPMEFQQRVRRAKAEMRTVSIRNDCLYIDYEYIGPVPPGMGAMVY